MSAHQWPIRLAVILLVSGLILYSLYLILTSWDWAFFSLFVPFLISAHPSPFSIFISCQPYILLLPLSVIYLLVSHVVLQHWCVYPNAGILSVMEPELYWDQGGFTPVFTNSHTIFYWFSWQMAVQRAMELPLLLRLSLKYLLGGFRTGTMGSLRGHREREKLFFEHLQCTHVTESVTNLTGNHMNNRPRGKE